MIAARRASEPYAVTPAEVQALVAAVAAEPAPQMELMEHHRRAATSNRRLRCRLTDAEFRAWLAAPLSVADLLRIELDEARYLTALDAAEAEEAADARVREAVAARAGRPSYADLCELRGEPARAAAAQARVDPRAFEGMAAATRAVARRRRAEARQATALTGGRG